MPQLQAPAVFLLNPNTLYLGSVPMTEPVFFAALFATALLHGSVPEMQGWGALLRARRWRRSPARLTRYEAWFLLPFVAMYICWPWRRETVGLPRSFSASLAGAGPALWLAHNRWYFGDPLYFYSGPYSALAIQGNTATRAVATGASAAQYFFAAGNLSRDGLRWHAGRAGSLPL